MLGDERGIKVTFGGGNSGMMGAVADAALDVGGEALGLVPRGAFAAHHIHDRVAVEYSQSFFARIQHYYEHAEAAIALPGGIGTLHELAAFAALNRCGLDRFPVAVINPLGYWEPLFAMFNKMSALGFTYDDYGSLAIDQINDPGGQPFALNSKIHQWLNEHNFIDRRSMP